MDYRERSDQQQKDYEEYLHIIAYQLEKIVLHLRWLVIVTWLGFAGVVGWYLGVMVK